MKQILLSISFLLSITQIYAQSIGPETINSSGNRIEIGSNTYEWSVGEMVLVHTASGSNFVVTQGILQPLIIEEDTTENIGNLKLTHNQLNIFPNPADKAVFLKPNLKPNTQLTVNLYDIHSRHLLKKEFFLLNGNEQQTISLEGIAVGVYMLEVHTTEREKHFKNAYKINKVQ